MSCPTRKQSVDWLFYGGNLPTSGNVSCDGLFVSVWTYPWGHFLG